MTGRAASSRVPAWVEPMLARADGGQLQTGPERAYEYMLDFCTRGVRCVAAGTR